MEFKFLEQTLKIPQDFISEMKEAFRYFDKVKNLGSILRDQLLAQSGSGFLSAKEMPALLRALGWNPTETEVRDTPLSSSQPLHKCVVQLGEHNHGRSRR